MYGPLGTAVIALGDGSFAVLEAHGPGPFLTLKFFSSSLPCQATMQISRKYGGF